MQTSTEHMSAFNAAFGADYTLIDIVPSFTIDDGSPILATIPVGPVQAGITTTVPLWMAVLLQQRSYAVIVPPPWWTTENFAAIIAHEKSSDEFYPISERLPVAYYEISKRITSTRNPPEHAEAMKLLVQDLLDIRVDKLRQRFQKFVSESTDTNDPVRLNEIGSQESALLMPFIKQALLDRYAMDEKEVTEDKEAQQIEQPFAQPVHRKPIGRRFRK